MADPAIEAGGMAGRIRLAELSFLHISKD